MSILDINPCQDFSLHVNIVWVFILAADDTQDQHILCVHILLSER